VHRSGEVACKAATTFRRCRPQGALPTSRCTHHRTPRKGATTQCAASTTKTARRPACAAAQRGSRLFVERLLRRHGRLGRAQPPLQRFPPQRAQELADLGGLADDPRQRLAAGCGFRHRRGRVLGKRGLQRGGVGRSLTVRPIVNEGLELLKPSPPRCWPMAMEARFAEPAPPPDLPSGHPLTAQVEGFQPHLNSGVRMMEAPIAQRFDVRFATCDLEPRRAPRRQTILMGTAVAQGARTVSAKPT
jgi:hypothetical protein